MMTEAVSVLSATVDVKEKGRVLPMVFAESLRLDFCHGCALDVAGIDDDGSTVAENYLQRRRVAFKRWRAGLNELGLTMCSLCGRDGEL